MIYDLSATFINKVYPVLGTPDVWKVYKEEYLLPNAEILTPHFNRWGEYPEAKIKAEVERWDQARFEKIINKVRDFDVVRVEQILKSTEVLLGPVKNLEIYFLIGNFRSGLYVTQLGERNVIVVAFEIVSNFGDLERVIVPSVSHELFHLYHFAEIERRGLEQGKGFASLVVQEGLACYFSYMVNINLKMPEVLLLTPAQISQIQANEKRYWQEMAEAMKTKSRDECNLLFAAPEAMWRDKLDYTPEWPARMCYYYAFKLIESYIEEKGHQYLKELSLLPPEEVIANSTYIKNLLS